MFVDECGINLSMARTHARAPIGTRAKAKRPKKSSNISLVGAIRTGDMNALYPYDGPIDGERFLSFLDNQLIPKLSPGDVVVMDNLRVHHIAEVKEQLAKAEATPLYLPPYSPERNPIEEVWSLIKQVFRTAEARTIPTMLDAMKTAKKAVTSQKIEAYFSHAGYS